MSSEPRREDEARRLGRCSNCDREIRPGQLLVAYERSNGELAMFAECPECGDVVHPT
jgi:predicted RNA-binding Zn-ribbon protein involved in translation (DUF1610 family)